MARRRRPPPGQCVHCLHFRQDLTWDHVFPKAWYPDDTPADLEKWKIPACTPCNREYGLLEEDLLHRLGLCISPEDANASGITAKVLRSVDPAAARNEKDRAARLAKRRAVQREMLYFNEPPDEGLLPGFGPQPGVTYPHYAGTLIPGGALEKLGEKIVMGITYLTKGTPIDASHRIEVLIVRERTPNWVDELIVARGARYDRGPGVNVARVVAGDDPEAALFLIQIWGRLRLHSSVLPMRRGTRLDPGS